MKNILKIIIINFVLFCCFSFIIILSPPVVVKTYSFILKSTNQNEVNYDSNHTPIYDYYDFIGWKHSDYKSENVNVTNYLRYTPLPSLINGNSEFWFFGGSAMWGYGLKDNETIPSIFSQHSKFKSLNFGESGYIARQSLELLNNVLIGESIFRPGGERSTIIFYDGVNDVSHRCRSEVIGQATSRQSVIRKALEITDTEFNPYSYRATFKQLLMFVSDVRKKLFNSKEELQEFASQNYFNCSSNPDRADYIAKTLVNTWIQASKVANANGFNFVAVLQPVSFLGNPDVSNIILDDPNNFALRKQYEKVYPLIQKYAKDAKINFLDATSVFENCLCYFDFSHVGSSGNQIISNWIFNQLHSSRMTNSINLSNQN